MNAKVLKRNEMITVIGDKDSIKTVFQMIVRWGIRGNLHNRGIILYHYI